MFNFAEKRIFLDSDFLMFFFNFMYDVKMMRYLNPETFLSKNFLQGSRSVKI